MNAPELEGRTDRALESNGGCRKWLGGSEMSMCACSASDKDSGGSHLGSQVQGRGDKKNTNGHTAHVFLLTTELGPVHTVARDLLFDPREAGV